MKIKEELEGLKKRMTRIETIAWLLLGANGIKLGGEAVSLVSAYMAKGVIG